MKRVVHAACPHDCPDACATLITVEDGRATRIQGDPAHPITQGFLCAKVAKYLDRVYSPDRVLYPMRRIAAKGTEGPQAFHRVGWDEALNEVTEKLNKISSEFGSEAILPYSYGGNLGALNGGSMDMRFFHRLGASQLLRTICAITGGDAIASIYGNRLGTEPEQFRHSKYIIAWAANIHGNNIHLWPFVEEARRNGAKLVVIDPYKTRTARVADWHIAINPGTDVALALGMLHIIVRDGLHDADYIAKYTDGFDELQKRLPKYRPQQVSRWTGISVDDIEKLAHGIWQRAPGCHPAELRHSTHTERRCRGARRMHVACDYRIVQGSWRRPAALDERQLRIGYPEIAAARPDVQERARPRSTQHQHG